MPKKPTRNAFYFYMLDFKEEQRKKGINYKNMAEIAEAAGPLWRDAPPAARAKFEEISKKEKQKANVPEKKYTSTGVSLADIEQMDKELRDTEAAEVKAIQNFVKLNSFNSNEGLLQADIYIMDVNYYCQAGSEYLIGESTILRFNLIDGIKDTYPEMINPGGIPVGYARDVKLGCEELGLNMPDDTSRPSNYMKILANTIDYLKQSDQSVTTLPPIYTMPDKVAPVVNFIQQMCSRAAEDETLFRVYKLDTLFYNMINAIKTRPEEGFPKISLALTQLKKDPFQYNPGLACEHHEEIDKAVKCTLSRCKRWAFTILDSCCPVGGVDMIPGAHIPQDYDMDSILSLKEQKRVRAGPSVAGPSTAMPSSNSSMTESYLETSASIDDGSTRKKKIMPKMRMPKTDYSAALRPAPELTDSDLLSSGLGNVAISSGLGRGRGRGNLPSSSK
ncbi:germ-plasm component protein maelstrom [Choristoneura fumiferana]|uniref:germ-plasm component protein maelstrom n=1 Tax=Choristoneura fumiferana TaxID=7141 RepID=UPI003D154571